MGQLEGRIALVSGGGRGIGRGISELLASEGAAIAVNYRRDADAAADTVSAIRAAGGTAMAFQASVDDPQASSAMVDAVVAEFGGLDILVCNAGIASRGNAVADTDPSEVMRVVAAHAIGPHHLARLSVPHLRSRERGDIELPLGTDIQQAASKGDRHGKSRKDERRRYEQRVAEVIERTK